MSPQRRLPTFKAEREVGDACVGGGENAEGMCDHLLEISGCLAVGPAPNSFDVSIRKSDEEGAFHVVVTQKRSAMEIRQILTSLSQ